MTKAVGMLSLDYRLPVEAAGAEVLRLVADLNENPAVHGILVQLPLPRCMDESRILGDRADIGLRRLSHFQRGAVGDGVAGDSPRTQLGCLMMLRATVTACRRANGLAEREGLTV